MRVLILKRMVLNKSRFNDIFEAFSRLVGLSPHFRLGGPELSGPVRDTSPYRAIPDRDSIAEGVSHPFCLAFMWHRASIAEIPLFFGGGGRYRTSSSHALQGRNAQKRRRGHRNQLAMLRHQKPKAHNRGVSSLAVSRKNGATKGRRDSCGLSRVHKS